MNQTLRAIGAIGVTAMFLALPKVARAQHQTPAVTTSPVAAQHPEEPSGPPSTLHQGIKVHGHWKIDIKNPDGSLASTHEFENSLADGGALIGNLLAGRAASGEAAIVLYMYSSGACAGVGTVNLGGCVISESSTGYWWSAYSCAADVTLCSSNLNVSLTYDARLGTYLVLSGSFVTPASPNAPVQIVGVASAFAACSSAAGLAVVTPAQCHTGTVPSGTSVNTLQTGPTNQPFTFVNTFYDAILPTTGQTIQVTVTLTFG